MSAINLTLWIHRWIAIINVAKCRKKSNLYEQIFDVHKKFSGNHLLSKTRLKMLIEMNKDAIISGCKIIKLLSNAIVYVAIIFNNFCPYGTPDIFVDTISSKSFVQAHVLKGHVNNLSRMKFRDFTFLGCWEWQVR